MGLGNIPQFLVINAQQGLTGKGFVLCTESPFIIAKVHFHKSLEILNKVVSRYDFHYFKQVPAYNITLHYHDNLAAVNLVKEEIATHLSNIMKFYFEYQIQSNLKSYDRYKIKDI